MGKKFWVIPLMAIILLSSTVPSLAINTRAIAVARNTTALNISSNGTAKVIAYLEADKTLVDKVTIDMVLEKKSGNRWSKVSTWNLTENSHRASISKSTKVTKGSSYRTKATYTVYKNGKMVERVTSYTEEERY